MSVYPDDIKELRNAVVLGSVIQAAATVYAADRTRGIDDAVSIAVDLALESAAQMVAKQ